MGVQHLWSEPDGQLAVVLTLFPTSLKKAAKTAALIGTKKKGVNCIGSCNSNRHKRLSPHCCCSLPSTQLRNLPESAARELVRSLPSTQLRNNADAGDQAGKSSLPSTQLRKF